MSTHNICFMENLRKLSHNYHHQILLLNKSSEKVRLSHRAVIGVVVSILLKVKISYVSSILKFFEGIYFKPSVWHPYTWHSFDRVSGQGHIICVVPVGRMNI